MGGSRKNVNKPRPSYEEGRLRDAEIERKQDPNYRESDLASLIKKAVRKPAKRAG